jgi:hypothetical protein
VTTPTPPVAPTLTIATDSPSYAPGDVITLTASYTDENGTSFPVEVTAVAADSAAPPNTATATTTFQVVTPAGALMAVTVTDDAGDAWTPSGTPVIGTSVFTTTAPSAP